MTRRTRNRKTTLRGLSSFRLHVSLFLAFDSASKRTDPFTSGKKYRKLVNSAVFIHNESLFFVSAGAMSAFQLEHTLQLLYAAYMYAPGAIEYGLSNTDYLYRILVMLV